MSRDWFVAKTPDDKKIFRSRSLDSFLNALRSWLSSDDYGHIIIVEKEINRGENQ